MSQSPSITDAQNLLLNGLLLRIKSDIQAVSHHVLEFILFGSATYSDHAHDVDIALIVPDETDLFEFCRAISPIVASHTADAGVLISCFPVRVSRYNGNSSQFLANVSKYGRSF